MAAGATFFQRFMLEHEWAGLRDVTLEAGAVSTEEQRSAAFDLLRKTCVPAFDCIAGVRIMAIGAAHLAFQHRMVMRHFKSRAHFEVTLETGVRRSSRINNLALITAAGDVETSRAVA